MRRGRFDSGSLWPGNMTEEEELPDSLSCPGRDASRRQPGTLTQCGRIGLELNCCYELRNQK